MAPLQTLVASSLLACLALPNLLLGCNKQAVPRETRGSNISEEQQIKEMEEMGMPPELIKSLTAKASRKAAVTKGKRLQWRTLWETDVDESYAMCHVANLDKDKDDEIYLHNTGQVFEVNGKARTLTFQESIDTFWDFDGDRIDDAT